jgi:hypothetical protein
MEKNCTAAQKGIKIPLNRPVEELVKLLKQLCLTSDPFYERLRFLSDATRRNEWDRNLFISDMALRI